MFLFVFFRIREVTYYQTFFYVNCIYSRKSKRKKEKDGTLGSQFIAIPF